ncbi:MAG: hypothetical protein HFI86_00355 [Bacilli bacterium]|nr:hypothetical protein [Bacilli bacterium]
MDNNKKYISKPNQEVIDIVNGKNPIRTQCRYLIGHNHISNINNILHSDVYKILLYSFKDEKQPYYVEDNKYEAVFNLMGSILVTVVNDNYVKEIKTGKIIPIVHLIKNNDYWTSSTIMSNHLREDDVLFTISQNKLLFLEPIDIRDFNTYLEMENECLEDIFNAWTEFSKKNIKVKKSRK